jgi:hypothetical protein
MGKKRSLTTERRHTKPTLPLAVRGKRYNAVSFAIDKIELKRHPCDREVAMSVSKVPDLKATLPTMYDLPSDNPEEPGLPDEYHLWQS